MRQALSKVDCKYGAPHGRHGIEAFDPEIEVKLNLEQVPLNSGGYDAGGAYWGLRFPVEREVECWPIGHVGSVMRRVRMRSRIYRYYKCAEWGEMVVEGFLDAFTRAEAKEQIRAILPNVTFYR